MYNTYGTYPCSYCANTPRYNSDSMYNAYNNYQCPYFVNTPMYDSNFSRSLESDHLIKLKDYGPQPFVVNINEATKQNNTFRTALWTGKYLQVTLMSINVGDDIGLEVHPDTDQFIRVEEGQGLVKIGHNKDRLDFQARVYDDSAIMIPAGMWHNVINTGNKPLKVYAIYAPPEHPRGTVHATKADAEAAEKNHR